MRLINHFSYLVLFYIFYFILFYFIYMTSYYIHSLFHNFTQLQESGRGYSSARPNFSPVPEFTHIQLYPFAEKKKV